MMSSYLPGFIWHDLNISYEKFSGKGWVIIITTGISLPGDFGQVTFPRKWQTLDENQSSFSLQSTDLSDRPYCLPKSKWLWKNKPKTLSHWK